MTRRWSELGWGFARSVLFLLFGCWWILIGAFCNAEDLPGRHESHVESHR